MLYLPFFNPASKQKIESASPAPSQPPRADSVHDDQLSQNTNRTSITSGKSQPSTSQVHRKTRTRKIFALLKLLSLYVSSTMLIFVESGNTSITSLYFFRLDLGEDVQPGLRRAVLEPAGLDVGLYDFYQVGLWNYCEGLRNQSISSCSKPQALYWFNPVEIGTSQILAGSTSAFLNLSLIGTS
jgi:hypothetical protein